MTSPPRLLPTDRERKLESLLQTAAEYEPESPMPLGLEARALAGRAPKRAVIALPWQPLAVVSGFALTVGVLWLAFSFRHKSEPANTRQTASLPAARSPYSQMKTLKPDGDQVRSFGNPMLAASSTYGAERTIPDRSHHSKSSQAAFPTKTTSLANSASVKQSTHSRPAGRLSLLAKGFNPSPARYQVAQVKPIEPKKKTIYPTTRPGFAEKQSVWRTEVVETETVGFAVPALLTRQDETQQVTTVAPAFVAFPVQDSDVFCAIYIPSEADDKERRRARKSGENNENH